MLTLSLDSSTPESLFLKGDPYSEVLVIGSFGFLIYLLKKIFFFNSQFHTRNIFYTLLATLSSHPDHEKSLFIRLLSPSIQS